MPKTFVLHDESLNTQGFRMITSGADLTEFRKNPVMLLNHNDWSMPIGRWENIRIEGSRIMADAVFDENDPVGKQVKEKVENNFLRAASIGAWMPRRDRIEEYDPVSGDRTVTVKEWSVREASIVTIPSNHNALAFYDRDTGKLIDSPEVLKLFDEKPGTLGTQRTEGRKKGVTNLEQRDMIKILAESLKLADTATESEVTAALNLALSDRDRLKTENETLTARIDELTKEAKQKQSAEAIALTDAAIKDGRIDAKARESYLKLFDTNFEAAKTALESIPLRQSISAQIEAGKTRDNVELADLQKATWDELDKQGKLVLLKDKFYDLYEQKFEQRFGVKPKK